MAVGEWTWCDYDIYTPKGLSVQRIPFDSQYWTEKFPKLNDGCIALEYVSALHSVELPMRKLIDSTDQHKHMWYYIYIIMFQALVTISVTVLWIFWSAF